MIHSSSGHCGRRARGVIRQNFVLSLDAMTVVAAISRLPAEVPLSVGVVLNSLRPLFRPRRR
jgi:hypothetical protein